MGIVRVASIALMAGAWGCAQSHSPEGKEATPAADAAYGAPDAGSASRCERLCAETDVFGEGGCFEHPGCPDCAGCVEECEARVDRWTDLERRAFIDCIANDPLCFQTLQQCIDGHLDGG